MTKKQTIDLKNFSLYRHEMNKIFVAIRKSEPLISKDGKVSGIVVARDEKTSEWIEIDGQLRNYKWQELDHHQNLSGQ